MGGLLAQGLVAYFSPIAEKGEASVRISLAMLVGLFAEHEPCERWRLRPTPGTDCYHSPPSDGS